MVTPDAGREMATHLTATYKVSERRACRVVGVNRATLRYRPQRKAKRVQVEQTVGSRLVELAMLPFGLQVLGKFCLMFFGPLSNGSHAPLPTSHCCT